MLYKFIELFLIGVALFLCNSCNIPQSRTVFGNPEKSAGQEIYEEVIEQVEERVLSDKWMKDRIQKKWYEGHEYLVMFSTDSQRVAGVDCIGFVHNPNCPCEND